jgi:uncharacterized protein
MMKLKRVLTACFISVLIAGCASSTPSRFYTLSTTAAPGTKPQADYSVSVGPVTVPAVVDRQQMAIKTGSNQVFLDENERWASPLKDNITRVVADDLSELLGTSQVTLYPQSPAIGASYRVIIDILRFEMELGKAATLDALWIVNPASAPKDEKAHRIRKIYTEPVTGGSYAELAAAQSRALGKLSADIAAIIQKLDGQKPR